MKKLKLKHLLKYLDWAVDIAIFIPEEEDAVFRGGSHDCPYWLLDLYLDNDPEYESIDTRIEKNQYGVNKPILYIAVKENLDD